MTNQFFFSIFIKKIISIYDCNDDKKIYQNILFEFIFSYKISNQRFFYNSTAKLLITPPK